MAEKAKKDNKNLIIGICAAVLVVVVIVVAVVFATKGTSTLSDAYFVSDDTKYVITVDGDEIDAEDEEFVPVKTHVVYTYSGDTITGMTTYMEFADEATAKAALASYQEAYADVDPSESGVASMSTNGKYLVVVATEDQYADTTVSDIKQYVEFMEMMENSDTEDTEDTEVDANIEEEDEE